jgi:hypothetical protein
LPPYQALTD